MNVYGLSKLAGEMAVRLASRRHYIIRVAGLYGIGGCRAKHNTNFVETILAKAARSETLEVVHEQVSSPTYALDAARAIAQLITTGKFGTYHVTNRGSCSWYEFAREILAVSGYDAVCVPIVTSRRPGTSRRPSYTALESRNLRRAGVPQPRGWRDALRDYLSERETVDNR